MAYLDQTTYRNGFSRIQNEMEIKKKLKIMSIRYRHTDNMNSDGYVYDNQIEAVKEILMHYFNKTRWVMLLAETQSGKTGVLNSLAYVILENDINKTIKLGGYDHVFILSGMDNTDLRDQFIQKSTAFTTKQITVLMNSDLQRINKAKQNIENADESDLDLLSRFNNALFIIDESHYGTNKDSVLSKFLVNGLLNLDDPEYNEKQNNWFLSVSATPMAESISNSFIKNKKEKVILKNGPGYYGIRDMFNNNMIEDSFDINNEDGLYNLIDTIKNADNGYIIIRLQDEKKKLVEEALKLNNIIDGKDILIKNYNGKSTKKLFKEQKTINFILNKEPKIKTIVFIQGMLRAGIEVNSKYVNMVHDTLGSNTDTSVQSLVGRLTGYKKNRNVKIYSNKEKCREYMNWVESGFNIEMTPTSCKHITKVKTNNKSISIGLYSNIKKECIITQKIADLIKIDDNPKLRNVNILKELLNPNDENDKYFLDILNRSDFSHVRLFKATKPKVGSSNFTKETINYHKVFTGNKNHIHADMKAKEKIENIDKLFINIVYEADVVNDKDRSTDTTLGNKLIINVGKVYIKKQIDLTQSLANVYLDSKSAYVDI